MVDRSSKTGTDPLAPVFAMLRLQGIVLATLELSPPWGLHVEGFDDVAFYFIARGGAYFQRAAESRATATGDLVIVAPGQPHAVRDQPRSRLISFRSLEERARRGGGHVRAGGGGATGATTTLLCGCFRFNASMRGLLLSCLPPLLHLEAVNADAGSHHVMQALVAEIHSTSTAGGDAIRIRLAEALFIHCLRFCIRRDGRTRSWLSALADPQIARALTAVHSAPERTWTVAALANEASLSRSAFALRFAQVVGEPPLAYVKKWRMSVAASLLESESLALEQIAERVGYGSDESFSRAFRHVMGTAPGNYRARLRRGPPVTRGEAE